MQMSTNKIKQQLEKSVSTGTRSGEEEKFWFRSDRFITIDNQWYFTTRENRDVGPFATREAAEHGLAIFIECIRDHKASVNHAIATASQGDWAVTFYH